MGSEHYNKITKRNSSGDAIAIRYCRFGVEYVRMLVNWKAEVVFGFLLRLGCCHGVGLLTVRLYGKKWFLMVRGEPEVKLRDLGFFDFFLLRRFKSRECFEHDREGG